MAQRQERLVDEIRAKRRDLHRSFGELFDRTEIEQHIRNEPLPWIVGGAVAGLMIAGFAGAPLVRQSRSLAGGWVRAGIRDALVDAVLAAVSRHGPDGSPPVPPPQPERHRQAASLVDPGTVPPE